MKKAKVIVGAILRGALLIAPGVLFGLWAWSRTSALIAILATAGVESLFIFVLSLIAVAVQAGKDLKHPRETDPETEE